MSWCTIKAVVAATSAIVAVAPESVAAETRTIGGMISDCQRPKSYCEAFVEDAKHVMQANCQISGSSDFGIGWFPSPKAGRLAVVDWAAGMPGKAALVACAGRPMVRQGPHRGCAASAIS